MKNSFKLSVSTAFALIMATSFAQAQDANVDEMPKDEMMEEHAMKDGDMSKMMGMMEKMEKMMESCHEKMDAKKDKADAEEPAAQDS